jgi:hypothetical protein
MTAAGSHVRQRTGATVKGAPTLQLVGDLATVTVPARGGPPIRIATALDAPLADGLSDLKLDVLASDTVATVAAPASFVDLANKNSLPAHFERDSIGPADNFQYGTCDDRGCTLSDLLRNTGGRLGAARATFFVGKGGTDIASCQVDIPPIDNGQTERVGCRVNWDTSLSGVAGTDAISNP